MLIYMILIMSISDCINGDLLHAIVTQKTLAYANNFKIFIYIY